MAEDDVDHHTPVNSASPQFDQVEDAPEDLSPGVYQDVQEEKRYQVKKKKSKKPKKSKKKVV